MSERIVLRGGQVFDGLGNEGVFADVLVESGVVRAIAPSLEVDGAVEIDAAGAWVVPGFVDLHTHYDAELEVAPGLDESLRHGVTTVLIGSCGLSMAVGSEEDLADMFCRVEGVPREVVLPLLRRVKDWESPAEYLEHLERLPLGPHVTSLAGHSALRAKAMGLSRSVDASTKPSEDELRAMERLLEESLDAGYLGLSINTLPWDKLDGTRHRSSPTPSVFATFGEYRRLAKILRARDRVFEGVPDLSTGFNIALFAAMSSGIGRKPLKTMIIALVDSKATRGIHRAAGAIARLTNATMRGAFRFQALPNPFDLYVDGLEVPVVEEFAAGTRALHEVDPEKRRALLRDPAYRRRFAKDWSNRFLGRAYHRDLYEARILACPDASLVGKSFGQIADERGARPLDAFLDLQVEHGNALRWYTVVGNDREDELAWIVAHEDVLLGFSDAGAHLRNMAYYNFPLRFLRLLREREKKGKPIMPLEKAVRRLTSEIAEYLGIDAGTLAVGKRADVVVVDPEGLDASVDAIHEAPMPGFPGLSRLVRRNDRAVRAVLVSGKLAYREGMRAEGLGAQRGFGTVLRAR